MAPSSLADFLNALAQTSPLRSETHILRRKRARRRFGLPRGGGSPATVEELREALLALQGTYNATWLIERHGFRPPAAVREQQLSAAALVA
jgi:hypothetical protein